MFSFFALLAYQLDLFKRPFTLNVNAHHQSSSLFGTFFSLGIFAVACLSFFQSNMFLKKNPYVLEKTVVSQEAPVLYFGNNLPISIFLTDTSKLIYKDDTYFKFQAFYYEEVGGINKTYTPVPLGPCPHLNATSTYQIYKDPNLSCISDAEFALKGTIDDNDFSTIVLQLQICNNLTDGVICKTPDEFKNFFIAKLFAMLSPNYYYDVSNYENPYLIGTNYQFQTLAFNKVQQFMQFNKKSTFTNDDFFLYDSPTQTNLTIMDNVVIISEPIVDFTQCNNPALRFHLLNLL